MFGEKSYAFGCRWMRHQITQVKDLWDEARNDWKTAQELIIILGRRETEARRQQIISAIPQDWCMRTVKPFQAWEWVVACSQQEVIDGLFQISTPPNKGFYFRRSRQKSYYFTERNEVDLLGFELHRARVVTRGGDLKSTSINPNMRYKGAVWLMGLVKNLEFDPAEWVWTKLPPVEELPFFNYSAKMGYRIGLAGKQQTSRLRGKHLMLGLTEEESKQAIKLQWHKTKPAKLQFFSWQLNSGGLPTGSWAICMEHNGDCRGCETGLTETLEHLFMNCRFERRTWRRMEKVREVFGLKKTIGGVTVRACSQGLTRPNLQIGRWGSHGQNCNLIPDMELQSRPSLPSLIVGFASPISFPSTRPSILTFNYPPLVS